MPVIFFKPDLCRFPNKEYIESQSWNIGSQGVARANWWNHQLAKPTKSGSANWWWFHQFALATLWEPIFQLWLSIYSILGNKNIVWKYTWYNVKLLIQFVFNLKNILDGSGEGLKDDYACFSKGKFQTF